MEPSDAISRLPFRACHFAPAISRLSVSLALILVCARFCAADPVSPSVSNPVHWDANAQGHFITCLCRDLRGRVWVGTEDGQGLWAADPAAKQWTHFPASPDLSGDIYALACDKAGRIWAGGLSGVSVYNGRQWRQYGPTDGPLGTRLFALAVSPKDGAVWGATEAGLFRYKNNSWTYYTRAEGLPSDQASSLTFALDGTLFVGTQCDGIAVGSPDDDYKTWRVTPGPAALPNSALGHGLPSGLINCLLVAHDGTVWAGTDGGLASSLDSGKSWTFLRGADWKAKLAGLYHPVAAAHMAVPTTLLREDYVTALAEDAQGRLWVSHRQGGVEAFVPKTMQSAAVKTGASTHDFVTALLPDGAGVWVGRYGGGLLPPLSVSPAPSAPDEEAAAPPLPAPASPPTLAQLQAMLARVQSLKGEMPVGGGAYLGEDWRTQGDWVGRYGRQYAVLCAVVSPLDQVLTWDDAYQVEGQLGPHFYGGDALRHYISYTKTNNTKTLYSPADGFRTQAEWDDHGEVYAQTFEGPDVWATVTVPDGIHRVSLYDTNKDGHDADNCNRDYLVDLLPYRAKTNDALLLPPLAHARIHNFWNGLYISFVVRGPAKYYLRVGRNGSKNTIMAGVFLDKLAGPKLRSDDSPMVAMFNVSYKPPDPDAPPPTSNMPPPPPLVLKAQQVATLHSARLLWDTLNIAQNAAESASWQSSYRLLAYRAALVSGASDRLQENWRWRLHFWTEDDRLWFQRNMELAVAMKKAGPPSY